MEYMEGFSVLSTDKTLSYRHKTNMSLKNRDKYLFSIIIAQVLPGGSVARKIPGEKKNVTFVWVMSL